MGEPAGGRGPVLRGPVAFYPLTPLQRWAEQRGGQRRKQPLLWHLLLVPVVHGVRRPGLQPCDCLPRRIQSSPRRSSCRLALSLYHYAVKKQVGCGHSIACHVITSKREQAMQSSRGDVLRCSARADWAVSGSLHSASRSNTACRSFGRGEVNSTSSPVRGRRKRMRCACRK